IRLRLLTDEQPAHKQEDCAGAQPVKPNWVHVQTPPLFRSHPHWSQVQLQCRTLAGGASGILIANSILNLEAAGHSGRGKKLIRLARQLSCVASFFACYW